MELLVVIAISALLAARLRPALQAARVKARAVAYNGGGGGFAPRLRHPNLTCNRLFMAPHVETLTDAPFGDTIKRGDANCIWDDL